MSDDVNPTPKPSPRQLAERIAESPMKTEYPEYPKTIDQIPDGECFAILFPRSTTIPGDERSKTNPGHGYPEHTEQHWEISLYPNRMAWEQEIQRLESRTGYLREPYKAVVMKPAVVTRSVTVS